ncbi:hypothetical protein N7532_001081 [Penicillium argentinense]|uniref:Carboxylic ester hydrolase n=1 Tax=Penicillium argentinense TaxID=1131581 RepID=A0A9W9G1T7_9EURO|nr:uncharacterized protein N7532_001081 [Penicillium argentinense]KAJ5110546.1 hypothetical protein N7532_001081 [Penicillium argentinense]
MSIFMVLLVIAGVVAGVLTSSHPLPKSSVVDLGYARYQGVSLYNGVDEYLGMRFAKPPLEELRFRGPQDPEDTSELQDASKNGPLCPGAGDSVGDEKEEDCLYLNVYKPTNASSNSSLPVWVFIQGGGYANNANGNYNGSDVVKHSGHDIVFVNFNYRVGALGFLAGEEVRKNGDLNVGLLDQRKALLWVQKYIQLFGGNPDHVVIHGDSAGAGSVALHLAAHGGENKNLFIGAVAESTFWPTQRTVGEMEFQYKRFVKQVGCDDADDSLACLRSADIDTLQKYDVDEPFPGGSSTPKPLWYFLPVVDGDLVSDRLYNSFMQDKIVHVPLIVTDDTNEGTLFAYNASTADEVSQFMKNNYPKLNEAQLRGINKVYPLMDPLPKHAAYFPSAAAAYGEATFTCPGNLMTASMASYFSSDKVWNYRFNIQDPTNIAAGKGVPHVLDLPAIFGLGQTNSPSLSFANINQMIIPITMDYYLSFIKTLNPNTLRNANAPVWETWGNGTGQRLKLQTNKTEMEEVPRAQRERCTMWKKFAADLEH